MRDGSFNYKGKRLLYKLSSASSEVFVPHRYRQRLLLANPRPTTRVGDGQSGAAPDIAGLVWQVMVVMTILRPVPVNENRAVQIYRPSTQLTIREQRALKQAEQKIARGLKSFLEVGMALKEIRDKRLYRQQYDTFEEYCIRRWELSRPRAYELCAASEVIADLSAIADNPCCRRTRRRPAR